MTIYIIADETYRELGSPATISIPSIGFWLRNHIGDLNMLTKSSYEISSDSVSIIPELGEDEKCILKHLFNIYYYKNLAAQFLGAASQDVVSEVSSDGATVRMVSKNELSKTYIQLKRDEELALKELIKGYNSKGVSPLQVTGDDVIPACTNQRLEERA